MILFSGRRQHGCRHFNERHKLSTMEWDMQAFDSDSLQNAVETLGSFHDRIISLKTMH